MQGTEKNADKRSAQRIDVQVQLRCRLLSHEERQAVAEQIGVPNPRIPSVGLAVNASGTAEYLAVNLSAGGLGADGDLQVMSTRAVHKGDDMALQFSLPDGKAPISAVGRVMWAFKGTDGRSMCGLMFVLMREQDTDRIRIFVSERANGQAPAQD